MVVVDTYHTPAEDLARILAEACCSQSQRMEAVEVAVHHTPAKLLACILVDSYCRQSQRMAAAQSAAAPTTEGSPKPWKLAEMNKEVGHLDRRRGSMNPYLLREK